MFAKILFSLTIVTGIQSQTSKIGRLCQFEDTRELGICTYSGNCQNAHDVIATGHNPTTCGYIRDSPLICCRNNSISGNPYINVKLSDHPVSQQKCNDYHDQVKEMNREERRSEDQFALPGEYPHVAAVGFRNGTNPDHWECTGTLISEKFVLASASCVNHNEYGKANIVRLGITNLYALNPNHQEFHIRKIYLRDENHTVHYCNDIALVQLDRPAEFNEFVYPACLPDVGWFEHAPTAVGWGLCESRGDDDFKLRKEKLNVRLVRFIECQGIGERGLFLNGDECVDSFDSALYQELRFQMFTLQGISSYAQTCILEKYMNRFTEIHPHVEWIEKIVWKYG